MIEKLSINAPSPDVKLKALKEIAREYNLEWDSSNAEAELSKRHEDLLVTLQTSDSVVHFLWLAVAFLADYC